MKITIIIPTYNEAENLPKLVSALFALPLDLNIIVVDDNSPDGTGQIADRLHAENPERVNIVHRSGRLGFGSAYLSGFESALQSGAEVIGQIDADFSHDPAALVRLAAALESSDVVIGSRYVPGGSLDERWPFWRKRLSAFGNFYARTVLGFDLRDVTGGFRLWKRNVLLAMPLERIKSNGYIFQVEMAYIAWCLKFKFGEVPIHFADRRWGTSKMSFRIQAEAALRVWQVKWYYRDLRKLEMAGRNK